MKELGVTRRVRKKSSFKRASACGVSDPQNFLVLPRYQVLVPYLDFFELINSNSKLKNKNERGKETNQGQGTQTKQTEAQEAPHFK